MSVKLPQSYPMFKKLVMEAVGVFLLCYIGGFAGLWSIHGSMNTEGSALLGPVLVYFIIIMGVDISGAHYNPAVTLVFYKLGEIDLDMAIKYTIAQLIGSLIGGMVLLILKPAVLLNNPDTSKHLGQCALHPGISVVNGFFFEFIATGMLLFTVMGSMQKKLDNYSMAFLIAILVGGNGLAFGNATGSCMNPARTFGPSLFAGAIFDRGWFIYYFATVLGGYYGAKLHRFLFSSEDNKTPNNLSKSPLTLADGSTAVPESKPAVELGNTTSYHSQSLVVNQF
jgi:MIP family channel proteins